MSLPLPASYSAEAWWEPQYLAATDSRITGNGSEEETRPSPTAVFSSHQLMTHMWFVMHQPHAGNPKINPIKASYAAKASVLCWPLPVLSLLDVGVGCTVLKPFLQPGRDLPWLAKLQPGLVSSFPNDQRKATFLPTQVIHSSGSAKSPFASKEGSRNRFCHNSRKQTAQTQALVRVGTRECKKLCASSPQCCGAVATLTGDVGSWGWLWLFYEL